MRVAAVDIGTNSTRLLVADVAAGRLEELTRDSIVTRLGDGVDESGRLGAQACDRVLAALLGYRTRIDELGAGVLTGVATSAVRESSNGRELRDRIEAETGIAVRVVDGDEEAGLTFAGASYDGAADDTDGAVVVIDIGGGSTEYVIGRAGELLFHTSTQIGALRHSERHLRSDPPTTVELAALAGEVSDIVTREVSAGDLGIITRGIAVAGTPTVLASVDLELAVFDPWKVHGHVLTLDALERILRRLAALPLAERRNVTGLHPDRAPTIVAGAAILIESLRCLGLDSVEVSEHDILYGIVLRVAADAAS